MVMQRYSVTEDDGVDGINVLLVRRQEKDVIRVPFSRQADEGVLQVLITFIEHRTFLFLFFVFIIVVSWNEGRELFQNFLSI